MVFVWDILGKDSKNKVLYPEIAKKIIIKERGRYNECCAKKPG